MYPCDFHHDLEYTCLGHLDDVLGLGQKLYGRITAFVPKLECLPDVPVSLLGHVEVAIGMLLECGVLFLVKGVIPPWPGLGPSSRGLLPSSGVLASLILTSTDSRNIRSRLSFYTTMVFISLVQVLFVLSSYEVKPISQRFYVVTVHK